MSLGLIKDYNKEWPEWFRQMQNMLDGQLKGLYLSIEHVGSTSVPGLNGKPIIDIDIVISKGKFEPVKEKLEGMGYVHQGDWGIPGREAFDLVSAEKLKELPAHYLYVCNEGEPELIKHIAFRDYLRKNESTGPG